MEDQLKFGLIWPEEILNKQAVQRYIGLISVSGLKGSEGLKTCYFSRSGNSNGGSH